jgi:ferredoxin-NADP reductase
MNPGPEGRSARPRSSARVERIFDHNRDTRSLFLRVAGGGPLRFVPGHFISIAIPLGDETRTRAYSIASRPGDPDPFEIVFNRVPGGRGVAWLFERVVGDLLEFTGPFGTFTLERAPQCETVFVAEGTAIAPIRPMIARALAAASHPELRLLYGAEDRDHLLYRDEFERLARERPRFEFSTLLAPRAELYDRLLAEVARRWIDSDSVRRREFYVCGIGKPVLRIRDRLRASGYERRAVHYEQW